MSPRSPKPIWRGALSFGLVQIPVKLYAAAEEEHPRLRLLHQKDLCPIEYVRVCRRTGKEVPWGEIVRGYEYQKGDYVILTEKDLSQTSVWRPRSVEIIQFTPEAEINPKYYEKPYYLEPEKGAERSYALLREALKRSGQVGIARFVLQTRERLGALRGEEEVIVLNQLRFDWQVRCPRGLVLPKVNQMKVNELDQAISLIDFFSQPFKPQEYEDNDLERMGEVIKEKVRQKLPLPQKQL